MFDSFPTYPRYRSLTRTEPAMVGEDVYALQTALNAAGFNCGEPDGDLGDVTFEQIRDAQSSLGLLVDGFAGGKTQESLVIKLNAVPLAKYKLPRGLLRGQLGHESSFRVGNYSDIRSDGSFDAGIAQRNTEHTPAEEGFNVPDSIDVCGASARLHFDKFEGVTDTRRRWILAQGAWNAPAYACFIANEEGASVPKNQTKAPSSAARAKLEQYMVSVSISLKV